MDGLGTRRIWALGGLQVLFSLYSLLLLLKLYIHDRPIGDL